VHVGALIGAKRRESSATRMVIRTESHRDSVATRLPGSKGSISACLVA